MRSFTDAAKKNYQLFRLVLPLFIRLAAGVFGGIRRLSIDLVSHCLITLLTAFQNSVRDTCDAGSFEP